MLLDLTTRDGYDIATALRGPDDGNDDAKALFTAVLRHYLQGAKGAGEAIELSGGRFSHIRQGFENTMENARAYYEFRDGAIPVTTHFLCHQNAAFSALARRHPKLNLPAYWAWACTKVTALDNYWFVLR